MKQNLSFSFLLMLFLLGGFGSGCNSLGPFASWNFQGKYQVQQDWTHAVSGIARIDTDSTHGSITYTGTETGQFQVHAVLTIRARTNTKAQEFARLVTLHVEQEGDTLRIYKSHPENDRNYRVGVSYTIQGPKNISADLKSTHGKIIVKGVEHKVKAKTSHAFISVLGGRESIDLRTTHGAIELKESSGRILLSTTHGAINAQIDTLAEMGDFSTTHGSINVQIHSQEERADFSTTHGQIHVTIDHGIAPIHAVSSHGEIVFNLPNDYSAQLDARTSHGHIESEFPIPVTTTSKNHLKGPLGKGGENRILLKTSHASIYVKKNKL